MALYRLTVLPMDALPLPKKKPKFAVWTAVAFHYHDWSWGEYDIGAEVVATKFDYDERRWYYVLKVDPSDVDKTDREGLEGPDRNLYGWVSSGAVGKPAPEGG